MRQFLSPLKKSTPYYFLLLLLLVCALPGFTNVRGLSGKPWKAVVLTHKGKIKGVLHQVSESSVVLRVDTGYTEIAFDDIQKIKLRPPVGAGAYILAFVTGATAGAAGGAGMATRGKQGERGERGEGATLAGIYGGFVGGLLGGIIGAALARPVGQLIGSERYTVRHDAASYPLLAAKLRRHAARQ